MRLIITICFVALALAGCRNSRDFVKPTPESLTLGTITHSEILSKYGTPIAQSTRVVSSSAAGANIKFTMLSYHRTDPLLGALAGAKVIVFLFCDDKLYAYNYVGDRGIGSSDFDDRRVAYLQNGVTRRQDIIGMLGLPSGRAISPARGIEAGEEKLIYEHIIASDDVRRKRLDLVFVGDTLKTFSYATQEAPALMTTPVTVWSPHLEFAP